jgi:ubiquitin-activating enzyme E1
MRARNYEIKQCDHGKTKMIAGKIIPAIATTTAMITGCVAAELYKYVQGMTNIEKFKNAFVNLALPLFIFSEPDPVKKAKTAYDPIMGGEVVAIPEGYTIYDKIVVKAGSLTFAGLLDWFKKEMKLEIFMVACGTASLYNAFAPGTTSKDRRDRKVEDVFL